MITNQKSKIRLVLVIFVFLVLSFFVLQAKFILSVNTNFSVNNSIDRNSGFEIMSAQTIGIGGGGGAKFPQQLTPIEKQEQARGAQKEKRMTVTEEKSENKSDGLTNLPEVENAVIYNLEILEAFENNSKVPVLVRLKDKSRLAVVGSKDERRALSRQRDEWFKPVREEVLATLSETEFELSSRLFNGFSGTITKEGFDKLLNNTAVKKIIWDNTPLPEATTNESIPLINADDVWTLGYTGSGVEICVIDSGVDSTHSDLSGVISDEYCYCSAPDAYLSSNDCCPDGSAEDDNATDFNGHGTHVVGIIASQDSIYRGVAYNANIYVVKVMNSSGNMGSWDDLRNAITWWLSRNRH